MPPAILAKTGWPFWDSLNPFKWADASKKEDAPVALRDLKHHLIMDGPDAEPYVATTILPRAQPAPESEPQSTEDVAAFFTTGPNAGMPEASGQNGDEADVNLLPALLRRQEVFNYLGQRKRSRKRRVDSGIGYRKKLSVAQSKRKVTAMKPHSKAGYMEKSRGMKASGMGAS
ncbi:hypothetical protein BFW01_g6284 [Lasiodiplodia theobromae]|nr:hypothetical protein BFW01_g6284 [Lasiodiplodia theobromae]